MLSTPQRNIIIEQARPDDLDTVIDILEEAAAWLTSRGIDQWRPGSFLEARYETIAKQVNRGEVYLATLNGKPVGTLTLQWEDKGFWGDVPDDAAYVHRIAIRRAYAGKELGYHLLQWAESTAAASGKNFLRLDCMAENVALCEYYERANFESRGEIQGKGWRGRLYEKRIQTKE
ncbi:MAG TPA: GNAT family N-acetyltransferase [Ktedonobacteraceae bacterium]|nr:GNAT family N-acetyltransferase [Ktedonobacteraceae bacterium]